MTHQTHTIAESNNFIVLDKYIKTEQTSDSYQSESDLERELIQDLRNQGYEFIPVKSQSAMLANVREQLQNLNGVVFNDSGGVSRSNIWTTRVMAFWIRPVKSISTIFATLFLMTSVLRTSI